jgi:hypothetical protein
MEAFNTGIVALESNFRWISIWRKPALYDEEVLAEYGVVLEAL